MKRTKSLKKELTKGFLTENPVLRLVLGTCPTIAVSSGIVNALGMGIATTVVLTCANCAISALRKFIPEKVRIPAYIVIIASFTTILQMLMQAYVPALNRALGVYLPLIVVNCILLGRAEAFARVNTVPASFLDGFGMGLGFTVTLLVMASVRELLGSGTLFEGAQSLLALFGENTLGGFNGLRVTDYIPGFTPVSILALAPGGFLMFGLLMAAANHFSRRGERAAVALGCAGCPMSASCSLQKREGHKTETTEKEGA